MVVIGSGMCWLILIAAIAAMFVLALWAALWVDEWKLTNAQLWVFVVPMIILGSIARAMALGLELHLLRWWLK